MSTKKHHVLSNLSLHPDNIDTYFLKIHDYLFI